MSKFILLLVCVFLEINLFSQNFSIDENEFLNYLGSNQLSKAKEILPKLIDSAKKEYKDTSFQFCKTFYYNALINIVEGSETFAIKNLIESKKYFKKPIQKECGFYHLVLHKLAQSYYSIYDDTAADVTLEELLNLENKCHSLTDLDLADAKRFYYQNAINIPTKSLLGAYGLIKIINDDIKFINDNSYQLPKDAIENFVINEIFSNMKLVYHSCIRRQDYKIALSVIDLSSQLKFNSNNAKFRYEILDLKSGYYNSIGDENYFLFIVNEQINLLLTNDNIYESAIDYYYILGMLYSFKKDYNNAIVNYELSLKLASNNKQSHIYKIEDIEKYLSICYEKINDFKNALSTIYRRTYYLKSINLFNEAEEINSYMSLCKIYFRMDSISKAQNLSDFILRRFKGKLSKSEFRSALDLSISISNKLNKYDDCYDYLNLAFQFDNLDINEFFISGSSSEKEKFWLKNVYRFENNLDIISNYFNLNNQYSQLAYNLLIMNKSFLLQNNINLSKNISSLNDEGLKSMFNELRVLKIELSREGLKLNNDEVYKKGLKQQVDSLDRILSRKMSFYDKKTFSLDWKDIQSNLSNTAASIEFSRYYHYKDSAYHYMALIVKPGDNYPQLVKLCKEDELYQYSPETELKEIYDLIWKPLLPSLTSIKTIYYSPSGLLNNVPFQALYKEENDQREYVMDKFTLHQLTSTRYLALDLKKKEQETIETSIALFGGINYNDYPNAVIDTLNSEESSEAAFLYKNAIVLNRELDSTRTGASFLPGTKKEVETIVEVLKAKQWQVDISEGKNATENKIKSLSGSNSKAILHIATHGFAYPDKEEKRKDLAFSMMSGNDKYKASDNPMIRSGLLFGGANITLKCKGDSLLNTTNEDGVLTAYELSQLDLSNTKLAVLSACETGKGAIQGSEGIFGLKRALKLAGVDNMIVSLWKVPDDATMEMMTLFYTELANTKKPVSSFETSQKAMRYKYPNEPKKWAGFVFVR